MHYDRVLGERRMGDAMNKSKTMEKDFSVRPKRVGVGSMTLSETNFLITEEVQVDENNETQAFCGTVISTEQNDVDGILITVMDQEDNAWDIEAKYVFLAKETKES